MQTSRFLISDTLNKSKAVICQQLLTRPIVPIVIISPCFHFFPSMLPPSLLLYFSLSPTFLFCLSQTTDRSGSIHRREYFSFLWKKFCWRLRFAFGWELIEMGTVLFLLTSSAAELQRLSTTLCLARWAVAFSRARLFCWALGTDLFLESSPWKKKLQKL